MPDGVNMGGASDDNYNIKTSATVSRYIVRSFRLLVLTQSFSDVTHDQIRI